MDLPSTSQCFATRRTTGLVVTATAAWLQRETDLFTSKTLSSATVVHCGCGPPSVVFRISNSRRLFHAGDQVFPPYCFLVRLVLPPPVIGSIARGLPAARRRVSGDSAAPTRVWRQKGSDGYFREVPNIVRTSPLATTTCKDKNLARLQRERFCNAKPSIVKPAWVARLKPGQRKGFTRRSITTTTARSVVEYYASRAGDTGRPVFRTPMYARQAEVAVVDNRPPPVAPELSSDLCWIPP
jgi:hypothetical protein